MTLALLDMPDDPAQLALWLERKLVSLELRDLVIELESIQKSGYDTQRLEDVCDTTLPQILQQGLQSVPVGTLRNLLRSPRLLVELQERILADGGNYWRGISITPEHQAALDRGKRKLQVSLMQSERPVSSAGQLETHASPEVNPAGSMKSERVGRNLRSSHRMKRALAAIGVAALLLVGVELFTVSSRPHGVLPDGARSNIELRSAREPGIVDLFSRVPTPVVFDADDQNVYSYSESTRRLTVASEHWSVFACGSHPANMQLDVATEHQTHPAITGVLWGLHSESEEDGSTVQSCLAVTVTADASHPADATIALLQLTIGDDFRGRPTIRAIHGIASSTANVNWSIPLAVHVDTATGELALLLVQGTRVELPVRDTFANWKNYSKGQCGVIAAQSQSQVVFTRALLMTHTQER